MFTKGGLMAYGRPKVISIKKDYRQFEEKCKQKVAFEKKSRASRQACPAWVMRSISPQPTGLPKSDGNHAPIIHASRLSHPMP